MIAARGLVKGVSYAHLDAYINRQLAQKTGEPFAADITGRTKAMID